MKKKDIPIIVDSEDLIPSYASERAAGADVRADIKEEIILYPGKSILIPTGLFMEIPEGFEIQVRPRSGLAFKNQITVLNTPGTIDSDFRGQICVILINHGNEEFIICPKMRIAQLVLAPVYQANFIKKQTLSSSVRGSGCFGHTGVH
jgi:dUTP pyrophosphatase